MKKSLIAVFIFLLISGTVFAQESDSSYYFKTMNIVTVYPHADGYKILYRNSKLEYAYIYVPMKWITDEPKKAELFYGESSAFPYFTVFWKNGSFDHIKLYFNINRSDISWGEIDPNEDVSTKFANVESIELKL